VRSSNPERLAKFLAPDLVTGTELDAFFLRDRCFAEDRDLDDDGEAARDHHVVGTAERAEAAIGIEASDVAAFTQPSTIRSAVAFGLFRNR
jgi:hypothetical protein